MPHLDDVKLYKLIKDTLVEYKAYKGLGKYSAFFNALWEWERNYHNQSAIQARSSLLQTLLVYYTDTTLTVSSLSAQFLLTAAFSDEEILEKLDTITSLTDETRESLKRRFKKPVYAEVESARLENVPAKKAQRARDNAAIIREQAENLLSVSVVANRLLTHLPSKDLLKMRTLSKAMNRDVLCIVFSRNDDDAINSQMELIQQWMMRGEKEGSGLRLLGPELLSQLLYAGLKDPLRPLAFKLRALKMLTIILHLEDPVSNLVRPERHMNFFTESWKSKENEYGLVITPEYYSFLSFDKQLAILRELFSNFSYFGLIYGHGEKRLENSVRILTASMIGSRYQDKVFLMRRVAPYIGGTAYLRFQSFQAKNIDFFVENKDQWVILYDTVFNNAHYKSLFYFAKMTRKNFLDRERLIRLWNTIEKHLDSKQKDERHEAIKALINLSPEMQDSTLLERFMDKVFQRPEDFELFKSLMVSLFRANQSIVSKAKVIMSFYLNPKRYLYWMNQNMRVLAMDLFDALLMSLPFIPPQALLILEQKLYDKSPEMLEKVSALIVKCLERTPSHQEAMWTVVFSLLTHANVAIRTNAHQLLVRLLPLMPKAYWGSEKLDSIIEKGMVDKCPEIKVAAIEILDVLFSLKARDKEDKYQGMLRHALTYCTDEPIAVQQALAKITAAHFLSAQDEKIYKSIAEQLYELIKGSTGKRDRHTMIHYLSTLPFRCLRDVLHGLALCLKSTNVVAAQGALEIIIALLPAMEKISNEDIKHWLECLIEGKNKVVEDEIITVLSMHERLYSMSMAYLKKDSTHLTDSDLLKKRFDRLEKKLKNKFSTCVTIITKTHPLLTHFFSSNDKDFIENVTILLLKSDVKHIEAILVGNPLNADNEIKTDNILHFLSKMIREGSAEQSWFAMDWLMQQFLKSPHGYAKARYAFLLAETVAFFPQKGVDDKLLSYMLLLAGSPNIMTVVSYEANNYLISLLPFLSSKQRENLKGLIKSTAGSSINYFLKLYLLIDDKKPSQDLNKIILDKLNALEAWKWSLSEKEKQDKPIEITDNPSNWHMVSLLTQAFQAGELLPSELRDALHKEIDKQSLESYKEFKCLFEDIFEEYDYRMDYLSYLSQKFLLNLNKDEKELALLEYNIRKELCLVLSYYGKKKASDGEEKEARTGEKLAILLSEYLAKTEPLSEKEKMILKRRILEQEKGSYEKLNELFHPILKRYKQDNTYLGYINRIFKLHISRVKKALLFALEEKLPKEKSLLVLLKNDFLIEGDLSEKQKTVFEEFIQHQTPKSYRACDAVFREALEKHGIKEGYMHYMVRVFGLTLAKEKIVLPLALSDQEAHYAVLVKQKEAEMACLKEIEQFLNGLADPHGNQDFILSEQALAILNRILEKPPETTSEDHSIRYVGLYKRVTKKIEGRNIQGYKVEKEKITEAERKAEMDKVKNEIQRLDDALGRNRKMQKVFSLLLLFRENCNTMEKETLREMKEFFSTLTRGECQEIEKSLKARFVHYFMIDVNKNYLDLLFPELFLTQDHRELCWFLRSYYYHIPEGCKTDRKMILLLLKAFQDTFYQFTPPRMSVDEKKRLIELLLLQSETAYRQLASAFNIFLNKHVKLCDISPQFLPFIIKALDLPPILLAGRELGDILKVDIEKQAEVKSKYELLFDAYSYVKSLELLREKMEFQPIAGIEMSRTLELWNRPVSLSTAVKWFISAPDPEMQKSALRRLRQQGLGQLVPPLVQILRYSDGAKTIALEPAVKSTLLTYWHDATQDDLFYHLCTRSLSPLLARMNQDLTSYGSNLDPSDQDWHSIVKKLRDILINPSPSSSEKKQLEADIAALSAHSYEKLSTLCSPFLKKHSTTNSLADYLNKLFSLNISLDKTELPHFLVRFYTKLVKDSEKLRWHPETQHILSLLLEFISKGLTPTKKEQLQTLLRAQSSYSYYSLREVFNKYFKRFGIEGHFIRYLHQNDLIKDVTIEDKEAQLQADGDVIRKDERLIKAAIAYVKDTIEISSEIRKILSQYTHDPYGSGNV